MFCPDCGYESTQGFNYCKRCGGSLSSPAPAGQSTRARENRLINAIWAVAAAIMVVGAGGMGITFGIAGGLAGSGIKPDDGPLAIIVCGSAAITVTLWLLVRQLSRLIGSVIERKREFGPEWDSRLVDQANVPARQIATPLVVPSVTEHTTRNFEQVKTTAKS